jgi:DnaJ-domain-containing protein 1
VGIREILDGAKTKISQLAQLVVVDDEPLTNVDGAALDTELKARKAWAERRQRKPEDGPIGKIAGSGAVARAQRERLATDRARAVHRDRDDRAARTKAAADDAFRRVKEQAARGGGSSGSSSSGSAPRPPRGSNAVQLTEWYKQLDVTPGADLAEIKSAYRKMMRKYHPDLQADPNKKRAATELTMRVNQAYNGLVEYLEKK